MEADNKDEPVIDVDEPEIDVDKPQIDVDEPVIDVDEGDEQNTEGSRLKSFVWKHFKLQVIDPNYRSYFRNEVEDDGEDSTRSRNRKKNDRVLGAPEEDDWEYARDPKFDVVGWWKQNSEKFPVLSQVARHVLAMPISTVASESAFSTGGRVIVKFRSSLTPKSAEALICTQDWLRSTPADVEDMQVNGQQLEDLVENLAKIELEMFSTGKKIM
ncbi:zinc finger, BED-type [Artemisia annua]|uniref:Zinc finger, BED-type n=1 Tax=Artemisia annua TaxID=35608 RepID=A0A2U1MHY2_ARTAN|nr:zinc finger, BED-type [Artemisia annua]